LKIEKEALMKPFHESLGIEITPKKSAVDHFGLCVGIQELRLLRHPCLLCKAKYPADFSNHQKTIPPAPIKETLGLGGCLKR